jgi:hypothetical protein
MTRLIGTLHEDQYTFMIVSRSSVRVMSNVSYKLCRENKNTYFMFKNFLFSKIMPFMGLCVKSIVEADSPQMRIWCMRIACWIPKATNTPSEYVILSAFELQQW